MNTPSIWARVLRADPAAATLVRVGPLTPYLTETIVEDALAAGPGSRLQVELSRADGAYLLQSLHLSLNTLASRGIAVDIRTGRGGWMSAPTESAA